MMEHQALSPRDLIDKFPWGMSGTVRIVETFRTPTGRQYGPEIVETGMEIGKEIYRYLLQHYQGSRKMKNDTITAIEGIRVGHAQLDGIPSGCTVILPDEGAVAGVDIRGGAPGTFGTDTLNPLNLVEKVNGLFFSGGSAFGLSAADGVRRYLKDRNIGFDTGHGVVPYCRRRHHF